MRQFHCLREKQADAAPHCTYSYTDQRFYHMRAHLSFCDGHDLQMQAFVGGTLQVHEFACVTENLLGRT